MTHKFRIQSTADKWPAQSRFKNTKNTLAHWNLSLSLNQQVLVFPPKLPTRLTYRDHLITFWIFLHVHVI